MRIKLFCLILLVTVYNFGCSKNPELPSKLQISKFRQGLVAFDSLQQPYIYQQGDAFPYKENGTCVADNEQAPCQWYGFEFNFKSPEEITKFECITKSSILQDQVTPNEVISTNSEIAHWGFTIYGHTGHYLRPQYSYNITQEVLHMKSSCYYKGQKILNWHNTIIPNV